MTAETFIQLINNGIPAEAIGGLTSAAVIGLWNKAKGFFKGNTPTEEEYNQMLTTNTEFQNTIKELVVEMQKTGYTVNEADLIVIKTQLVNPTFQNTVTFQ
jgi:hypothetical protein